MSSLHFEQGKIAYWNGEYVPLAQVRVSPYDLGFLRGYAVFDVLPIVNRKPFLWERHWERFEKSAETLGLRVLVRKDEWKNILLEVVKQNLECGSVRTVLSGGPSADAYVPEQGKETFLVLPEGKAHYSDTIYTNGVKVVTLSFARQFPWAKIANHVAAIRHLPEKKKNNAFEILYVYDGIVLEAATSNIAMVSSGKIITPKDGVLSGITMGLVLELAEKEGIAIESRNVSIEEFLVADEVFLTASSKKIVPVVGVDEHTIASGVIGPITKRLMRALDDFVQKY